MTGRRARPVERITTVEVPVADLERAVAWYECHLVLVPAWGGEHEARVAVRPGELVELFLVQSDSAERLTFRNSRHGYTQSVVCVL